MITQLIHIGPQASRYQHMKGDTNETLLLMGAILFWAAVLPIVSIFVALAVLWDRIRVSLRRGQPVRWGGVLSHFRVEQARGRIRARP